MTNDSPEKTTKTARRDVEPLQWTAISALKPGQSISDGSIGRGHGRLMFIRRVNHVEIRYQWYVKGSRQRRHVAMGRYDRKGKHGKNLDEARVEAITYRKQLTNGLDPREIIDREEAQAQRIERAELETIEAKKKAVSDAELAALRIGTLEYLINAYADDLLARGKTSHKDTRNTLTLHVTKAFPEVAAKPARDVSADDVTLILAKMLKAGITTRVGHVQRMLHAAYQFGMVHDHDPEKVDTDDGFSKIFSIQANPVASVKRQSRGEPRKRVLSDDELRHYITSLRTIKRSDKRSQHVAIHSLLDISLLLGGQRISQLKRLKWSDYQDRVITLVDGKGRGKPRIHKLPVSRLVADKLALLRLTSADDGYVFSTDGGKTQIDIATASNAAAAIRDEYLEANPGGEPYNLQDVRRTVETLMAGELDIPKDQRAHVLSHGRERNIQDTTYDQNDYLPQKGTVLASWERFLRELLEPANKQKPVADIHDINQASA